MESKIETQTPSQTLSDTQQFWLSHYQSCQQRGMTIKAYVKEHQLKPYAFNSGIRRLREMGVIPAASQRRVEEAPNTTFQKVVVTNERSSRAAIMLHLKNGHRLEIPAAHLTTELLQQLNQLP